MLEAEVLEQWVALGMSNPWIAEAVDPPFTRQSIHICSSREELVTRLFQGSWCLGRGFALGELCLLNQIDGGDEWLVIKRRTVFESITAAPRGRSRLQSVKRLCTFLDDVEAATETECHRLLYRGRGSSA